MEKYDKKRIIKVLGISLILVAGIIWSNDAHQEQQAQKIEEQKIEQFFKVEKMDYVDSFTQIQEDMQREDDSYIAVLEIPKIHLKKGLYDIENRKNNIDQNIQILKESDFPDVKNGTMILVGHSGIGKLAYFNHLDMLQTGNLIFLYYQGVKYVYQLSNSYEIEKTGYFKIPNNHQKNTLLLITCKIGTNLQLVFNSELIYQESI